jgi:adenylyl-sulfate kinase
VPLNAPRSSNVTRHDTMPQARRWATLGLRGATVWFTGMPAAGKSTIAAATERRLVEEGRPAYVLDGDNLRHGLNGDLGFSREDRDENVRRTAHLAALMADGGAVALVALVSPYRQQRESARLIHEQLGAPFIEAFIDTPLAECERRDPKGLYARARQGELRGLTGVDEPYEVPARPNLVLRTSQEPLEAELDRVLSALAEAASSGQDAKPVPAFR